MRCHARKNGFVSHVTQERLDIVLTFLFHTCYYVMFTVEHREVLNIVRSDKHVGVLPTQASLDSIAHTRDAKRIKSLVSRLDAMKGNPKF